MREINFYRLDNGRCPVEEYLDTLSNKKVEKVFFILELIESLDIVPRKFLKSWNQLMVSGRPGFSLVITFLIARFF
jgi:hypothetical protein